MRWDESSSLFLLHSFGKTSRSQLLNGISIANSDQMQFHVWFSWNFLIKYLQEWGRILYPCRNMYVSHLVIV